MKLGLNFLSKDEKHRIHKDSINILSRVGVKFISNKALKILEKNGASVDYDTRIAEMPEEMPLANVVWPLSVRCNFEITSK